MVRSEIRQEHTLNNTRAGERGRKEAYVRKQMEVAGAWGIYPRTSSV